MFRVLGCNKSLDHAWPEVRRLRAWIMPIRISVPSIREQEKGRGSAWGKNKRVPEMTENRWNLHRKYHKQKHFSCSQIIWGLGTQLTGRALNSSLVCYKICMCKIIVSKLYFRIFWMVCAWLYRKCKTWLSELNLAIMSKQSLPPPLQDKLPSKEKSKAPVRFLRQLSTVSS